MDSQGILDREFLEVRAKLLEVAAALDRQDRAPGDVSGDPRRQALAQAIEILATHPQPPNRAEQLQLLFSRDYQPDWKARFDLSARS